MRIARLWRVSRLLRITGLGWVAGWLLRIARLGWVSRLLGWIVAAWLRRVTGRLLRIARLWRVTGLWRIARLLRIARLWRVSRLLRITGLRWVSRLLRLVIAALLWHTAESHTASGTKGTARTSRGSAIRADCRQWRAARVAVFLSGSIVGAASGTSNPLLHLISPLHP